MHFHLPKPLHGWREFAGEVGIIVVGVLIALGAEQVVETLHSHQKAEKADKALRTELSDDYIYADEAVLTAPCVDRQLQALETRLVSTGSAYAPAPMYKDKTGDFIYRAPSRPWGDEIWRSVEAEGISSAFRQDVRAGLSDFYVQIGIMRDNTNATDLLGWRLRVLSQPLKFDSATAARLVQDIEEARGRFRFNRTVGNQLIGRLNVMGRAASAPDIAAFRAASGTIKFCREHHLPLGKIEPQEPR